MRLFVCLCGFLLMAAVLPADVIQYDGSYLPTPGATPFSWAINTGTNMQVDSGVLEMTTATGAGVWFGNHSNYHPVSWHLGSPSEGNYVSVRAKVDEGSSGWNIYLEDTQYWAAWSLSAASFRYRSPLTTEIATLQPVGFHEFKFWLRDGMVAYVLDGTLVYSGAAERLSTSPNLIIGDGSGAAGGGVGSMYLDSATIITGGDYGTAAPPMPTFSSVPEPSAWALLGAAVALIAGLKRR